ncbi:non-homologous end-joining DNA ligase [Bosea sp. NBC_00550]|uniref:non-homologous end-joining DNA ligase n=1 Tax=Bosea sp. NBC_00550 TaxID=2969621 RepID=UPI0022329B6B|nr:non-homologous end-joining DNA ligase [Bosea sp. NBC_00550]UZF92658.1 non-homologous end-joining DNA ligase [Bosea sp. NBC_00550]
MCARRVLRAGLGVDTVKGPVTRRPKIERNLFSDPMPERVEPCLALLQSKPPTGDDWAFEVKWDGYRLGVHIGPGKKVRVITRGGHDWTSRFPTIAHDALEFGLDSAILDGEAVVLDERGASDFGALQKALGGRSGKRSAASAMLYAFDLLYLNGHDLRSLSLDERRAMLEDVLASQPHGSIRLGEEINTEGAPFLKLACELGLEGIIAKRRSAPYRSGRGGDWLKIKCVQSEGFVIIGYEPSTAALGGIGRLVLAARKAGKLVYVGSVGTGFSHASATALRKQMDKLVIPKPAVSLSGRRQAYRWLTPALVAEVEFRAWTDDGKLRHASFKGLREEADEASVYVLQSSEE